MDPLDDLRSAMSVPVETLEPLAEWIHVQPSADEERAGRIYLPAGLGNGKLQRSMVLAVGDSITDLAPGDIVLVLAAQTLDLRDGSKLAQRDAVVARVKV